MYCTLIALKKKKQNKEYSGYKENLQFLAENDIYLYINVSVTIQPRVDTFC